MNKTKKEKSWEKECQNWKVEREKSIWGERKKNLGEEWKEWKVIWVRREEKVGQEREKALENYFLTQLYLILHINIRGERSVYSSVPFLFHFGF